MRTMDFSFQSRRSMVAGRRGMVAASNPLASQAGLRILQAGGTAADAAIAAAAVLNVTEAASTGIGGDCFALYYDASGGQIRALNGSGRAPAALSAADLRARGWTVIPPRDAHAVTVPGAARGWEDLLARHGRMTLKEVLADAIAYARGGFPVQPVYAEGWRRSESVLRAGRNTTPYLPGGSAPKAGEIAYLPELARTFEQVAEGGADAFYHGPIAQAIARTIQAAGGAMTTDDLAAHRSTWETPIGIDYRGVTVWECPPNGQGIAALQALGIIAGDDIASLPWDGPERVHLMVEAMRLAFADARQYVADMATNPAPVAGLLHPDYLASRRALISPDRAMQPPTFGQPFAGTDTVYLCVVDGEGSGCSFINSLYMGFGSAIVAEGTGVCLQNRGAGFVLEAGHPNELQPGKRPYHTIIPALATRDGALWATLGVMGGFMQPQGHMQVVSAMLDDDLNPQEALNRPRWCLDGNHADAPLLVEEGYPVATMARLADIGHPARPVSGAGRGVFGDGQIIRRDAETGVLLGGSDPRKDGQVAAW
jgi:gamma-glutamyltranspeptidase / glutathione hydrolase